MTIALQRSNGDLIWFDAILQYNRQMTSTITKHPVETGASVSDNTTRENLVMQISGVVSDADFNLQRPNLSVSDSTNNDITRKTFVNNTPVLDNTVQISTGQNSYTKYLPETLAQFVEDQVPTVTVSESSRPVFSDTIENALTEIWNNSEEVSIIEFDGDKVRGGIKHNCIMISLSLQESPDSGAALWPEMTFEQVTYVTSESTTIPKTVNKSITNTAATKKNKGSQTGEKSANVTGGRGQTTNANASEGKITANSGSGETR